MRFRHPAAFLLAALLQAALASATLPASEIICRYCGHDHAAALLPPGMELDGKYQYAPARQVDVTHIKLVEGDQLQMAKLIPIIGKLQVEVLPDEPEPAGETDMAAADTP